MRQARQLLLLRGALEVVVVVAVAEVVAAEASVVREEIPLGI